VPGHAARSSSTETLVFASGALYRPLHVLIANRAFLVRERLARTLALEGQEEPRRLGRLLDHRRVARAGDEPDR
jgi:hypothetical protein